MLRSQPQQDLRRSPGIPPSLLPALKRAKADPEESSELGLREAVFRPDYRHVRLFNDELPGSSILPMENLTALAPRTLATSSSKSSSFIGVSPESTA